ncbi:MAG: LytTR family DNA-binding domain-containing protein, partial [Ferruginibacter sp.]
MNKVLIVDDNKVIRLMLSEMLKKIDDVEIVGECESAIEARSFLSKNEVDILLLDVEMPGMTGLELLKLLPVKPATILITAKTGYAIEAFELNVIDYLVKPISIARVMLAIEKAKELLTMKNAQLNEVNTDQIFIRDNKVIRKILLKDIFWLEAKGDYVKIKTAESQYIIHSTLKNMEEKLPASEFVRIHRGYLIPVSKIDYIEDGVAFIMATPLPVSETYKNDLLKKLQL